MKTVWILLVCLLYSGGAWCGVVPGSADFAAYGKLLEGKRVGVVANQTAVVGDVHTVDFLPKTV